VVTPVLIANREFELLASADDRVVSRLQAARWIPFDQYSLDVLVAILSAQVR
jgi:ORC complex protein Cdc6/Orc1